MNIPIWARRLIVLLFMASVMAVLYFSLPVDSRGSFISEIKDLGGALFLFLGVTFVFIQLVRWADKD